MNRRTYAQRTAARQRAHNRPAMITLAALSCVMSGLFWTFLAACISQPGDAATYNPQGFADALAMVGLLAIVSTTVAALAIFETRA